MKNLLSLMEEFSILGMEPSPLEITSDAEFSPQGDIAGEEYELDANGNPVLDAQGNPVKKLAPAVGPALDTAPVAADGACTCAHTDNTMAPAGGLEPRLPGGIVPQLPEEDEFDFNI